MESANSGIGEKALSKIAEVGIASQLDQVESIDVDVCADPGKLVQGEVSSVAISGKGMVMKKDLRVETLDVNVQKISIDPLSAVFGNIELTHPTDAEAQIVLSESDINRAFNSSFIQEKLQGLQIEVDGHSEKVNVREVTISLLGDCKFAIDADLMMGESEAKKLAAVAIPKIKENGTQISLEILSYEGQGLTNEVMAVILEQLSALLDLKNFDIPGMSLQLNQLEVRNGELFIHARTLIDKFPSA